MIIFEDIKTTNSITLGHLFQKPVENVHAPKTLVFCQLSRQSTIPFHDMCSAIASNCVPWTALRRVCNHHDIWTVFNLNNYEAKLLDLTLEDEIRPCIRNVQRLFDEELFLHITISLVRQLRKDDKFVFRLGGFFSDMHWWVPWHTSTVYTIFGIVPLSSVLAERIWNQFTSLLDGLSWFILIIGLECTVFVFSHCFRINGTISVVDLL